MANILFDSMGAQVQVHEELGNRLTTWFNSLSQGHVLNYTDYTQPITPQLQGNDVLVILTRQWSQAPSIPVEPFYVPPNPPPFPNLIPQSQSFSFSSEDLVGIANWVAAGNGLLLFTNHTSPTTKSPYGTYWPIYGIQLAAALGITFVYASFAPTLESNLTMTPAPDAPAELITNVASVQAFDSGGILPGNGQVILPLPTSCEDRSPFGYLPANYAFAVLYQVGLGNVIAIGHSGITANADTSWPSPGQIGYADNEEFLNNCITYLAGTST